MKNIFFALLMWTSGTWAFVPPAPQPKIEPGSTPTCLDGMSDEDKAEIVPTMTAGEFEKCFNWSGDEFRLYLSNVANDVVVQVSIARRVLTVSSPEGDYRFYISPARPPWHTLTGTYTVGRGDLQRMHYSKKWNNSPMPYSVFYRGGFAIHGTYEVSMIGRPASHGCIRLRIGDAKIVYGLVEKYGQAEIVIR